MAVRNSNKFDFSDVVAEYLSDYSAEAVETLTATIEEVAKESVKRLKASSPKLSGEYAKNWKYKIDKGRITAMATVYGDAPTYRMAHLLEYGHAKRGGGRVRAIPHIQAVNDWAVSEAIDRYMDRMEGV